MGKENNNKNTDPELVYFMTLCRELDIPRQSLITWNKFLNLPAIIPMGKTQKWYPLKECVMIIQMFRAELAKGFKRKFAAANVKKSKKYKTTMEELKERYSDYETFFE